jgi:uncharacterized protein YpuA (DUF1002 family)
MEAQALENRIKSLETLLEQANQDSAQMSKELSLAKAALEKINLPKINKDTVNDIREAIQHVLDNYDFNNPEEYMYDFEISYDNQLQLCNLEFENVDEIAEQLSDNIEALFNIEEDLS